jgi:hypothetical protein
MGDLHPPRCHDLASTPISRDRAAPHRHRIRARRPGRRLLTESGTFSEIASAISRPSSARSPRRRRRSALDHEAVERRLGRGQRNRPLDRLRERDGLGVLTYLRDAAAAGRRPPRALSFAGSRRRPVCGGGSRPICVMLTRSRWRTKGSRCRSSKGSSNMPTSASRRFISKESTRARSSTRSTTAGRR